jgi:hypothetical protein
MSEIFADTFYFLALLSPSDKASQRAWSITAEQRSTLVTTAWVLGWGAAAEVLEAPGLRARISDIPERAYDGRTQARAR